MYQRPFKVDKSTVPYTAPYSMAWFSENLLDGIFSLNILLTFADT